MAHLHVETSDGDHVADGGVDWLPPVSPGGASTRLYTLRNDHAVAVVLGGATVTLGELQVLQNPGGLLNPGAEATLEVAVVDTSTIGRFDYGITVFGDVDNIKWDIRSTVVGARSAIDQAVDTLLGLVSTEYGRDAVLHRDTSDYSRIDGEHAGAEELPVRLLAPPSDYSSQELDGQIVETGDVKVLIRAADVPANKIMEAGWTIELPIEFGYGRLIVVRVAPKAGTSGALAYELQCRK